MADTSQNGYTYQVVVTDSATVPTSVTSAAATLTVNAALSTSAPTSVSANVGQTATFSVTTTGGTSPIFYQWQLNPGGLGSFGNISGATSSSYTTDILTILGNSGDLYRVFISDSATVPTSVTSAAATLTVTALRASSPGNDFTNGAINSNAWDSAAISPEQLTSISCPNSSFCMAVDTNGTAFHYDGKNWITADMIDNGHPLKSVSCANPSHCVAIDTSGYAFIYNGTWSTDAQFDTNGEPTSISCPSSSFCMVIDNNANAFVYNGKTWSDAESVGIASNLTSVSCSNDGECIAVDAQGNGSRYDGTMWTAYSANPISAHRLNAVSCTPNSGSFCMAIDNAGNAFSYNGTTWTHQYDDGAIDSEPLNSVSCLGSAFCMVVDNNGGALRYNGTSWSAVSDIDGTHSITSLSCPTSSFCMGVDHAGNAWEYRAEAANIAIANPGDTSDSSSDNAPLAQSFSVKANGNAASTYKITGFSQPKGVYIDTNNNLWIADSEAAKVYRFPASAQGALNDDLKASVMISNDESTSPSAIVTDSSGNIYVADHEDAIFIYPATAFQVPGTYDAASPSRTITGKRTGLHAPQALAVDGNNNIWVANQSGNSIEKFAAGTEGESNIEPAATISGTRTLLDEPNGIFIDTKGNIWVTNAQVDEIHVFKADSEGNIAPSCIIKSAAIHSPTGITVDSQGNIYQVNDVAADGAINIFAPVSATCDTTTVTPVRSIAGANTVIGKALGLSIGYVF